jgi:hypothetical protein
MATPVLVPEAPMYKNDLSARNKNEVRLSLKSLGVERITIAQ